MASTSDFWKLVERQHGVIDRRQLLALGYSPEAIRHRIERGRLHRKARGVYAVGRPELSTEGTLMVAVRACAPDAFVASHTAAGLFTIRPAPARGAAVHISPAAKRRRRVRGITAHQVMLEPADQGTFRGIPITSPARTLADIARDLDPEQLERAVNLADSLDLADPDALRGACERLAPRPGAARLARLLDRRTFRLTDSVLEQRFLAIALRAGLDAPPDTRRRIDGYRTDFAWPALRLIVETDSLRYHRTPTQQYKDRKRDQAHLLAGWTPCASRTRRSRGRPRPWRRCSPPPRGGLRPATNSRRRPPGARWPPGSVSRAPRGR